ncbi:filamin-A-like isoform X2 [Liolophura sinensis]
MPSQHGPQIRDNTDGSIVVQYQPQVAGRHEVNINHSDSPVPGTPFCCIVDSVDGGFVTAYGQGLAVAMSGEKTQFTVVTKGGSAKNLDVYIDGPMKIQPDREDRPDGSSIISYMPMTPGAYNISVKFRGKHIKGSPFAAKVSGEGRKRSQFSVPETAEYSLGVMEPDIVSLVGNVKTPSGNVDPCLLKKLANGNLGIASFTPRERGRYEVSVLRDDRPIKGSPFRVDVGEKDIAHASKVKVTGKALREGTANSANVLTIDASQAGYGGLSVVVEGPHRSDITLNDITDKVANVKYSPHEPGIYILNIRFADEHIPGSPYLVDIGGQPSGRVRECGTKHVNAAEIVGPNSNCELLLKLPGTNPFDMEASLTDPSGSTEVVEVVDEDDFHYIIRFQPKVKGTHTISVKHKSMHVSGSPFQYTVGSMVASGHHKVQVGGTGLERGEVGINNDFNVYTREAGSGELSIAIEGPSKAKVSFEERSNGMTGVSYVVDKPGKYGIHVKFNDEHIPNSPFIVNVAPDSGAVRKVTIHSLRDKGLEPNKPATFSVNLNGAKGELHATIFCPSGAHEDCFIQEMDTDVYGLRFVPKEKGVHYVHIMLNDTHIPESPYAMMVGSLAADPAMLHAFGDGLEKAKTGQKNKFVVRTANAGAGTLAVFIEGPSRSALSCKELDEGYEFIYTPFSPGNYLITIKYGNIRIAGSPFQAVATGVGRKPSPITEQSSMVVETVEKKPGTGKKAIHFTGDASKVVAKGNGLKKAFTNRLLNVTIDIKDAGNALLSVGMMSPSGKPEPELSLKQTSKTVYTLSYKVAEIGEHTLSIKFGEDDIPGSPFMLST